MTSAEAARPTLPNIALNALYVACLLWLDRTPKCYETVTLTARVPVIRVTRIDRFSRAALRRVIADGVVRRCVEDERRTPQFAAAASPGTAVF